MKPSARSVSAPVRRTLDRIPEFQVHVGRGWYTSENALVKFRNKNDANGYYKALGLLPDATKAEIKKAFRKIVKTLHPDRGGDEELFRFIVEIADVLLSEESKTTYDSVDSEHIYLGDMEREELLRAGFSEVEKGEHVSEYWACLTDSGFSPDIDTDAWTELCREVSPAVGYRGKIRVGVVEGGRNWPCDPATPWGILTTNSHTFVIFQRGIEPNRLHALCAMIDWQNHLTNQWAKAQNRERASWL